MSFQRKILSICSVICFFIIHSSTYPKERKNYFINKINPKDYKIANYKNIDTVVIEGIGETIEKASQNAAANALTKVVGSFIDVEKVLVDKQKINKEIIEFSQNIKIDIKEYSQGFIRFFEILNIEKKNNIFTVSAKVKVSKEEFSSYLREFSNSKSKFPGKNIATILKSNNKNLESSALILVDKIIEPLLERSVYEIEKGNVQLDSSNLVRIPIRIKLNKNFLKNIEEILNNISFDKASALYQNLGKYPDLPLKDNEYFYEPSYQKSSKDIFVAILEKDKLIINEFKIKTSQDFEKLFTNSRRSFCYKIKGNCGFTKYSFYIKEDSISNYGPYNKILIPPLQISLLDNNNKLLKKIICDLNRCYKVDESFGKRIEYYGSGPWDAEQIINFKKENNKKFTNTIKLNPLDKRLSKNLDTPLNYSLVGCESTPKGICYLRIDTFRDYELILDLSPEILNLINEIDIRFNNDYGNIGYDSKKAKAFIPSSYEVKRCNKKYHNFKISSINNPTYLCMTKNMKKKGEIFDHNGNYIGSTKRLHYKIIDYCYGEHGYYKLNQKSRGCSYYLFEKFSIEKNTLFKKICKPKKEFEDSKYCNYKNIRFAEGKKFLFW